MPWIVVRDNIGIFHNMGREVGCLWEERTSLGSPVNVIRKRRAREPYKGEKMVIAIKKKITPFHFPSPTGV